MAATDSLLVEHPTEDIVVFRINRPQVRNALNLEVRVRLADEITRCGADNKVRCVIVTGSDVAFAAGADIGEMAESGAVEVMSRNVQKYWRAIMDCPKPVIAAVEGSSSRVVPQNIIGILVFDRARDSVLKLIVQYSPNLPPGVFCQSGEGTIRM